MTDAVLPLAWYYLPVAFVLGAFHALEPGHGKSLASAYLVSGKHDWTDAVVLGLSTTFSHTAVVVLLALASLSLSQFLSRDQLNHGVAEVGAIILVGVGARVMLRSVRDLRHGHLGGHDHDHGHPHGNESSHAGKKGLWAIALLGLSNGILPCPGALAALLVALSLGKVFLGMTTVLTYSLGLATALATMGILVVEAGRRVRSWLPSDRALLWLPLGSGLLVFSTGTWLLWSIHVHA
jgi:nickel/cobalt transporter (NicO) family protein